MDDDEELEAARKHGLFVGTNTFEIDLFHSGWHKSICKTLSELAPSEVAAKRAASWEADPKSVDEDRLIKDIEAIGKGRFSQRLATRLAKSICPEYILDAINYLNERLS